MGGGQKKVGEGVMINGKGRKGGGGEEMRRREGRKEEGVGGEKRDKGGE